jgi:hypothetical protein
MCVDTVQCKNTVVQLIEDFVEELEAWALSTDNWEFIEHLTIVLQPFNEYTNLVSETSPTIITVFAIFSELEQHFKNAFSKQDIYATCDPLVTLAIQAGASRFNKYFKYIKSNIIFFVASVLDPRIKGAYILSQPDGQKHLADVRQYIHRLYQAEKLVQLNTPIPEETTSIQLRILRAIHKDSAPMSDVDQYFDSQPVPWQNTNKKSDFDWVLHWWRIHKSEYPIMSQIARDYLAIQASEVCVERVFSEGRDLLAVRRHALRPESMRVQMLLRDHLRKVGQI